MVNCSILGCNSRSERKHENITFHTFPKNLAIREVWVNATGRQNWKPTKYTRICSKHFEICCFRKTEKLTFLRPNSIPKRFVHDQNKENVVPNIENIQPGMSQGSALQPSATECTPRKLKLFNTQSSQDLAVQSRAAEITPRKRKLLKALQTKTLLAESRKRKLALLRSKTWRLRKKVANLNSIIQHVQARNLINQESADMLTSISPTNKEFLKKFFCKNKTDRQYSPELRKLALTLHFISPRAYNFVRQQFNTCLPHTRTLSRWYQCVDGNPGFCKEALEALKLLVKKNSKRYSSQQLRGALCFDEIAIRKFVELDGENCIGFIDYGNGAISESLAKEALVFMLTAVNGSWKIPLGYFLIDGITAEQKASLVKTCIDIIEDCGINVISVTCDGTATNLSMAKLLGCGLDVNDLNPVFTHNNKKVVIFPDPSHMLKLVRNTLGDKLTLTDGKGRTISWTYIKALVDLQENEGFHLANKLRSSHINYSKQILKVKLAAQVFSNSVADAIEFANKHLKLKEFENSEATVEFIRKINNVFDILNSRNLNAYDYKKPLSKKNFVAYQEFLKKMLQYLNDIKLENQYIFCSKRKTGFLGFSLCIKSVLFLYKTCISKNLLKFIGFYKLSQDHIEYFFSAIRAKGGFNNNPTAKQFRSAFKRLLIHGEIKHIATGNCIPLQEINILTYNKPELAINSTTDKNRLIETEDNVLSECVELSDDHDYLADPTRLNEYTKQVITYIAGFVVTKIESILKCDDCLSVLINQIKYNSLQYQKDKGGLHYPTKDVVTVCEICEKVFRKHANLSKQNFMHHLLQDCLSQCLNINFFQYTQHFMVDSPLDSHYPLLLKLICMNYLKVRVNFATKKISECNDKVRNYYNKLILFKGQ